MGKLPQTVRQVERKLKGVRQSVEEVNKATKEVDRLTSLGTTNQTQKVEVRKPTLGESLLAPTQDFVVSLGLVTLLLYFLLASEDMLLRKLVVALPRFHDKKMAVEISRQIEQDISLYLITIIAINTLFGLAIGVAMYFLGLPAPHSPFQCQRTERSADTRFRSASEALLPWSATSRRTKRFAEQACRGSARRVPDVLR